MKKKLSISDSELEVLKELWQDTDLTARQLTDRLQQRTQWSEATIKTLLLRLLQKNAAAVFFILQLSDKQFYLV